MVVVSLILAMGHPTAAASRHEKDEAEESVRFAALRGMAMAFIGAQLPRPDW